MTNDRNGTVIADDVDYVVIGPCLKDIGDGRVQLKVGSKVLVVDAAEIARVSAFSGGGGGPHAEEHEDGGGDEINVGGLSGVLADPQTPAAHKASHENGGGDEISVAGLSGLLADGQTPLAHSTSHKHGGGDEVAVAAAAANAIPKAGAGGTLAKEWLPDATTSAKGAVELATDGESAANVVVQGNDARMSNARTPTSHAATHQHSGGDEVGTATPGANAIPKAGAGSELAAGWLPTATTSTKGAVIVGTDPTDVPRMSDFVDIVDVPSAGQPMKFTAGGDVPAHGHATLQPIDALLTAIAALSMVADRYIYGTGTDTVALGTITTAGRAILDDADAAAQRTTLGCGTAAALNEGLGASDLVNVSNLLVLLGFYQGLGDKGIANGYAALNASAVVQPSNMPAALTENADTLTATTDAGNEGYVPVRHFIRRDATRTLPNDTNENAIFNSPTNGRLTLETGCYLFDGIIYVTTMSGTSGNASIDILGAGTATCAAWLWHATGIDASDPTLAATQTGTFSITQQSAASVVTAAAGTALAFRVKGTFEVTGAGTLIPSIDLVTAAAGVVAIGSYLAFERIGSTTAVSLGQWD